MPRATHRAASTSDVLGLRNRGLVFHPKSDALAQVLVDGEPIGPRAHEVRTPSPYDVRPVTKFAEVFAAAVAVVLCPLTGASITTKDSAGTLYDRPDLHLHYQGVEIGLEHTRADPHAIERAGVFEIELDLRNTIFPERRASAGQIVTLHIPPREGGLPSVERCALLAEFVSVFREKRFARLGPCRRRRDVFPPASAAHRRGVTVTVVPEPATSGHVNVVYDDESLSATEILRAITDAIAAKRERAKSYPFSGPLWLLVEIPPVFTQFLFVRRSLHAVLPALDPFEHLIVHDGRVAMHRSAPPTPRE